MKNVWQSDRQTDGRTERNVLRAAWSQLEMRERVVMMPTFRGAKGCHNNDLQRNYRRPNWHHNNTMTRKGHGVYFQTHAISYGSLSNSSVRHWNGNVFILMKFSSLAALKVVKMTTSSAASDENFVKMTTFSFQWRWYRNDIIRKTVTQLSLSHTDDFISHLYDITTVYLCNTDGFVSHPSEIVTVMMS